MEEHLSFLLYLPGLVFILTLISTGAVLVIVELEARKKARRMRVLPARHRVTLRVPFSVIEGGRADMPPAPAVPIRRAS